MQTIKLQAEALLAKAKILTIASIDEKGYPRPVPMAKIHTEGIRTIWFATGTSSAKTEHFRHNSKAGVSFFWEDDSVVLTGHVEIVTDLNVKREYWQEWMINHFPKGIEDPEYTLFKFTVEEAVFWIQHQFLKTEI